MSLNKLETQKWYVVKTSSLNYFVTELKVPLLSSYSLGHSPACSWKYLLSLSFCVFSDLLSVESSLLEYKHAPSSSVFNNSPLALPFILTMAPFLCSTWRLNFESLLLDHCLHFPSSFLYALLPSPVISILVLTGLLWRLNILIYTKGLETCLNHDRIQHILTTIIITNIIIFVFLY